MRPLDGADGADAPKLRPPAELEEPVPRLNPPDELEEPAPKLGPGAAALEDAPNPKLAVGFIVPINASVAGLGWKQGGVQSRANGKRWRDRRIRCQGNAVMITAFY